MEVFNPLHPIRLKKLKGYIKRLDPIVYYPLWEESGTTARNYAPQSIGSYNGTITGTTLGKTGQAGKSIDFNGTSDKITVSDNAALRGFANASWVFMLKLPETSEYRKMIKSNSYDIGINDSGFIFSEWAGVTNGNIGTWDSQPAAGVDDNIWRIYTLTYDGTNINAYINGTSVESTSNASGSLTNTSADLVFGVSGTEWYEGLMQHLALFDKALTANQALKLAQLAGLA